LCRPYCQGLGGCETIYTGLQSRIAVLRPFRIGAWGTQAWINPVKGVTYVLMVQRSNFPNRDASDVRREFQKAAATALANGKARP